MAPSPSDDGPFCGSDISSSTNMLKSSDEPTVVSIVSLSSSSSEDSTEDVNATEDVNVKRDIMGSTKEIDEDSRFDKRPGGNEEDVEKRIDERGPSKSSVSEYVRKAGVAAVGGSMTALGLVMVPLPTPFGVVVAGAGMAVLSTEFPAAQKVMDRGKETLYRGRSHLVRVIEETQEEERREQLKPLIGTPVLTSFGLSGVLKCIDRDTGTCHVAVPSIGADCYLRSVCVLQPLRAAVGELVLLTDGHEGVRGIVRKFRSVSQTYEIELHDSGGVVRIAKPEQFDRIVADNDSNEKRMASKKTVVADGDINKDVGDDDENAESTAALEVSQETFVGAYASRFDYTRWQNLKDFEDSLYILPQLNLQSFTERFTLDRDGKLVLRKAWRRWTGEDEGENQEEVAVAVNFQPRQEDEVMQMAKRMFKQKASRLGQRVLPLLKSSAVEEHG